MKTKNENKKFTLEKFEVAKLSNSRSIYGGTNNGGETQTNGDKPSINQNSSIKCILDKMTKP